MCLCSGCGQFNFIAFLARNEPKMKNIFVYGNRSECRERWANVNIFIAKNAVLLGFIAFSHYTQLKCFRLICG